MIKLPLLTEKNLEIFKGKRVILYGHQINDMMQVYRIMKYFKIDVIGYFSEEKVSLVKTAIVGIKKLTLEQIDKKKLEKNNIIFQSIFPNKDAIALAEKIGIEISDLKGGEISLSFGHLAVFPLLENPITYFGARVFWKKHANVRNAVPVNFLKKNANKNAIILCLPPKTADVTIRNTIKVNNVDYTKNLEFINLLHRPKKINIPKYKKNLNVCRIIVALRDPIAQNSSLLFHNLATGNIYFDWLLGLTENVNTKSRKEIISQYKKMIMENGDNVQILWEQFIDRYIYDNGKINQEYPRAIQQFVPEFTKNAVDIIKYPFDKEKGYTIIKEGNIEVFIYQLEKLNNLVPELSEWMDIPFNELVPGNIANDKWIADSYKQAQKEIEITQEYFDRCYNEPYVQHCYSQADIEKFKERWRPHIK